ncbi:hypothetical protein ECC01_21750 [Bacillus tequilensis]|nr:hypothetical protein [Bacillus tequilensis]
MNTAAANANGHRRRQLRIRVLSEEHTCALCNQPVDKTLTNAPGQHGPRCRNPECTGCIPHPMRAEVDEDIPRARGGSPYERDNTHLMHRECNRWKGTMTLAEAHAKRTQQPHASERVITTLINW